MENIIEMNFAVNVQEYKSTLNEVGKKLQELNLTLSFAESATAGRVASEFAMIENAGSFLHGGIICYDASVKENLLNVDPAEIKKYTPESPEVTEAIAKGLEKLMKTDISIGITGLTKSGGSEHKDKPVGTMFIYAMRNGKLLFSDRSVFSDTPEHTIIKTTFLVAKLLLRNL